MCACKKWKEPIGKNPLELNYGLIQGDFFVLMVIFCKNGTLSAKGICRKNGRVRIGNMEKFYLEHEIQ